MVQAYRIVFKTLTIMYVLTFKIKFRQDVSVHSHVCSTSMLPACGCCPARAVLSLREWCSP